MRSNLRWGFTVSLLLVLSLSSGNAEAQKAKPSFDHSHKAWNKILREHVKLDGSVSTFNYRGLKGNRGPLDAYLATLERVSQSLYDSWNEKQRMSFLINAYNAFTVKIILDNYPVESIKDIGSVFKSTWKKKFFTLFGEKQHLDHIEHGLLRVKFKEPRIHFAVNCASIGCPALRNEAFVADKLERQLENATKIFLSDPGRNSYDPKKHELKISKIFKWFSEDFEKHSGSVSKYVAKYVTTNPEHQAKIRGSKEPSVDYNDYDWNLNETKK